MYFDLKLAAEDDPILREVMPDFNFVNSIVDPIELAKAVCKFMIDHKGIGLACNQVGLRYRMFTMKGDPNLACFNPKIVDTSEEQVMLDEGCLSFPRLLLPIKRPKHIKVRFTLPNGEVRTEKYTGITARCFQHELDHLNGIIFQKRAGRVHLALANKRRYK